MNISRRFLTVVAAASLVAALGVTSLASASPSFSTGGSAKAVYNAIPAKVSGNVFSIGFQATQTSEFGDAVGLAGTARTLQSMTVLLSSFACETGAWDGTGGLCMTTPGATFSVPLTFTIYDFTGDTVGSPLATQTQTFDILYRPSASTICADPNKWYNKSDKTCYNGLPQTFKMAMTATAPLPDQVIWSVAFSTSGFGPSPTGVAGPADSLNVGTWSFANAPFSGTDLDEAQAYRNGAMEGDYTGLRPLGAIGAK